MISRIAEGVLATLVGAILLAVTGQLLGVVQFQLGTAVLLLACGVSVALSLLLRLRHRVADLQRVIAAVPYSAYYPDESHIYPKFAELLKDAQTLQVVGLANTSVFHLFDVYKHFLMQHRRIELLSLDPDAQHILSSLDRVVNAAAAKQVLPTLQHLLEKLPISEERRRQARELLTRSSSDHATTTMISVCLLAWQGVAEEADKESVDSSRFLDIRLYRSPPTIKGWIIGDHSVLRGDFAIPGYGIAGPVIEYKSDHAKAEASNFRHTFQLFWSDRMTRALSVSSEVRVDYAYTGQSTGLTAVDGSFYESSGTTAVKVALEFLRGKHGATVVDLGCGTGFFSLEIAKVVGASGHVLATDVRSDLTGPLENRLRGLGWPPSGVAQIEVRCEDAHRLVLAPEVVDVVWCRHAMHHFVNPDAIVARIWNWLKPGGIFVMIDVEAPADRELVAFLDYAARLANPDHVRYYSRDEMKHLLQPFAFEVTETASTQDYSTPLGDYARRCSTSSDWRRLHDLAALLKTAPPAARRAFNISGDDISSLCLVLSEMVLFCQKPMQKNS